jgi:hypothetical protein
MTHKLIEETQIKFKLKVWGSDANEVRSFIEQIELEFRDHCILSPVLSSAQGGWHSFVTVTKNKVM